MANRFQVAVENVWLHRLSLITACATFVLLFIGGLVTSKGVGLAVPDWPTTFGANMFLFPWSKMTGGVFYEHSHRLVASGVGLLTLIMALLFWIFESRRWIRWLGLTALALVISQGVIGGLRVVLLERTLAVLHGSLAQVFFALMVSLVLFTSKEWGDEIEEPPAPEVQSLFRHALLTTGLIYLQGIFGSVLRYTGAVLEVHLLLAFLVALHAILLTLRAVKSCSDQPKLSFPALLLSGLLVLQLALGLGSYIGKFAPFGLGLSPLAVVFLTTTHVVTGALMLVTSLVVALRSYRMQGWPTDKVFREQVAS